MISRSGSLSFESVVSSFASSSLSGAISLSAEASSLAGVSAVLVTSAKASDSANASSLTGFSGFLFPLLLMLITINTETAATSRTNTAIIANISLFCDFFSSFSISILFAISGGYKDHDSGFVTSLPQPIHISCESSSSVPHFKQYFIISPYLFIQINIK